jgi:uncharacterized protein (TIGR03083 family)
VKTRIDYLEHLAEESARFSAAIRTAPSGARVPACPDWDADDLLWHLGEVQWFWGTIVRENLTGPQAEQIKPARPDGREALLAFLDDAGCELGRALAAAAPQDPAWTWTKDQSVGFIQRKQAHEALIHRVDAEEAAGSRTGMDPELSADGVDEALRVMYCGLPDWGTFTPDGRALRLQATDTDDSWLVQLGRFTGTDSGGTSYDELDIHVAEDDQDQSPVAWARAGAADLDLWLWHRSPTDPIALSGDEEVLRDFQAVIAPGLR